MKSVFSGTLTFLFLLGFSLKGMARTGDNTYVINIAKKDSSVRANVCNDPREIKTRPELTYYWYAYNKIYFTQGGYDGRLLHGEYVCFYSNGNIKQKGNFKNGLKEGEWVAWHENGIIAEISHWRNGLKQGELKKFSKTGDQVLSANFKKDKLDGTVITYDSGKMLEKKKYRNGEEIILKKKQKSRQDSVPSRENSDEKSKKQVKEKKVFHLFHFKKNTSADQKKSSKEKDNNNSVRK